MTLNRTQTSVNRAIGAIAATAFLGITTILPQAAFSQSPGASGDPRVDEPNTNNRVDDPSRPATGDMNRDVNAPANSSPSRGGVDSNPSGQSQYNNNNNSGFGGGAGGVNYDQEGPPQPANRIERYSQPGATDPSRSTEYLPPANSTEEGNTNINSNGRMNDQMNNSGFGGGTGGTGGTSNSTDVNRGNDRYTAPNNNLPGRGTYTTPQSQNNTDGGVGGGTGGTIDNQINNSTSPGSATPGSGSSNIDNNRSNQNNGGTNLNNNGGNTTEGGANTGGGAGGTGAVQGLW